MRGWKRKRLIIWTNKQGLLKLGAAAALAVLTVFMLSYELPHSETWNYWTMPLSGKVIAVDAGHGGPDGGASSKEGVNEKDINLDIAKHLRDYLQEAGAIVVMTREEDKDLAAPGTKGYSKRKTEDLQQRANLINKAQADFMISIHLNSIPSPKWHGAQTFYHPDKPGAKTLATHIQEELKRNLQNTDRVAKENDTFYPMKAISIPGALVEVGFLSNPEEARLMGQEGYQKKVAASIYQGILKYCAGEQIGEP
ncbi:N-acetylmuramoyl-L-alanine amidase CwlD [Paenibacillus sp. YN15]|uniref:N-acetylmuramoyl-L-alanine amidase CwlD n=1 Tax=Paenibacillus sp. YN15 TaxID=1742774 RepID=UPI000DCDAD0F|nr:N-acetylmuramoyl-L-alanine amidase CwlD [Paenibacillus sp. YN15]RAU94494.1 N-acetylmuramoyl-L-alanine amidase CwlD [Paenibacillus sp. YN15]